MYYLAHLTYTSGDFVCWNNEQRLTAGPSWCETKQPVGDMRGPQAELTVTQGAPPGACENARLLWASWRVPGKCPEGPACKTLGPEAPQMTLGIHPPKRGSSLPTLTWSRGWLWCVQGPREQSTALLPFTLRHISSGLDVPRMTWKWSQGQ